jgi:hypothetical protein
MLRERKEATKGWSLALKKDAGAACRKGKVRTKALKKKRRKTRSGRGGASLGLGFGGRKGGPRSASGSSMVSRLPSSFSSWSATSSRLA